MHLAFAVVACVIYRLAHDGRCATGRVACGVLSLESERTKLRKQHVVGWLVLRMLLEDGALEILHSVRLAVKVGYLCELVAEGQPLLGKTSIFLPVFKEPPAYLFACFLERLAARLS